jgi:hypothetical protein
VPSKLETAGAGWYLIYTTRGFCITEGDTQKYFQLRNQSGDRRRWKYSLFVIHIKNPRRGVVSNLLSTNQRVSEQELNTRRGFKDGEHHTINRQRTGAGSWILVIGIVG